MRGRHRQGEKKAQKSAGKSPAPGRRQARAGRPSAAGCILCSKVPPSALYPGRDFHTIHRHSQKTSHGKDVVLWSLYTQMFQKESRPPLHRVHRQEYGGDGIPFQLKAEDRGSRSLRCPVDEQMIVLLCRLPIGGQDIGFRCAGGDALGGGGLRVLRKPTPSQVKKIRKFYEQAFIFYRCRGGALRVLPVYPWIFMIEGQRSDSCGAAG